MRSAFATIALLACTKPPAHHAPTVLVGHACPCVPRAKPEPRPTVESSEPLPSLRPTMLAAGVGEIRGRVRRLVDHEPLPGVTVIVESPQLASAQVVVSDEHGAFELGELPSGECSVTFYYADISITGSVFVRGGTTTSVFQTIDDRGPPPPPIPKCIPILIERC